MQTYLRTEELLSAYKPNLVLLDSLYTAKPRLTLFQHLSAIERDENNLAKFMGRQNTIWPLPKSWAPTLWKKFGEKMHPWMTRSLGLRLAILALQAKINLLGNEFRAEENPFLTVFFRYLNGIKKIAAKHGAELFVLDRTPYDYREYLRLQSIYKKMDDTLYPEWISDKLMPSQSLQEQDFIDIPNLLNHNFYWTRIVTMGLKVKDDQHLSIAGMQNFAEKIASGIDPLLRILCK